MSRIVKPKEFLEAATWPAMLRCTDLLSLQSALTQFFGEVLFGQSVHSKREAENLVNLLLRQAELMKRACDTPGMPDWILEGQIVEIDVALGRLNALLFGERNKGGIGFFEHTRQLDALPPALREQHLLTEKEYKAQAKKPNTNNNTNTNINANTKSSTYYPPRQSGKKDFQQGNKQKGCK